MSGAAGGVGSRAVQFAKARGARVTGSAGSAAKVAPLTGELGADAAFDHHAGPANHLRMVGFARLPEAFAGLLAGRHTGRTIVAVGEAGGS